MKILGISAYFHDSAAALVEDGEILAAVQEERFTRARHDSNFPTNAIKSCLEITGISAAEIDFVVFYDKPLLKFERLLETYLSETPRGFSSFRKAMPLWLREKLFIRDLIAKELRSLGFDNFGDKQILFSEHHLSHAASAFYPSPFAEAGILTIDGVGEWTTTSIAQGSGAKIEIKKEIHFPHSLGLLYSAFTSYCGFKVNSGEYKLMGLAPYGKPDYANTIRDNLIDIRPDGSYHLNMDYFDYATGLKMTNAKFDRLFGRTARKAETGLDPFYMDIAASIQDVCEEVVEKLCRHTLEITGSENLCLAGGVALNCVANGKVLQKGLAKNIWVQPAAGDAGGAIGAALAFYFDSVKTGVRNETAEGMKGCYLGASFSQDQVEVVLKKKNAVFHLLSEMEVAKKAATILAEGKAVGWFQGRMEFGPRALGNRSVLADPRNPEMQKNLNLKIKFRESFRPFAPVVLAERAGEWFGLKEESPYMMFTTNVVKAGNPIPAVTHVNGSARVQTVDGKTNPKLHALLSEFDQLTACPVLVNTSFNVRGEPIVNRPEDAYDCFMSTGLDALFIENCFLLKSEQPIQNRIEPKIGED
jgi:carbamoyltransferase